MRLLIIPTVQQILNRSWMDITAQSQQDQDSTLRVTQKEINKQSLCSLISKKFLFIFFYEAIQPQKNLIIDTAKQGGNVLLLHILICPGRYSFFWCQSLQTYPFSFVLLMQFMQLHSAVGYLLIWFPLHLLNRTLHLCYCFHHLHYRWNSLWNYGTWDPTRVLSR